MIGVACRSTLDKYALNTGIFLWDITDKNDRVLIY